jgi:shikimate dehydrogenase
MTDRYAVVGNPISHSKSPQIHAAFARQTGQELSYATLLAPLDGFAAAVADFFAEGGKGLNITVPFKEEAWALAAVRSQRGEKSGAVNTLLMGKDGRLYGDTTDGVGLLRDLQQNHGVALAGRRLLVLGAGGAVRGVLHPLLAAKPAALVICNRSLARADELVRIFADEGPLSACDLAALAGQQFDVIINGTSASLSGAALNLPDGLLAHGGAAYDMVYGKDTPFLQWARQQGAGIACDGLGMLVEQAAEAFFLWRHIRPDTAPVMAALRQPT